LVPDEREPSSGESVPTDNSDKKVSGRQKKQAKEAKVKNEVKVKYLLGSEPMGRGRQRC
jgi:hypothetical protein